MESMKDENDNDNESKLKTAWVMDTNSATLNMGLSHLLIVEMGD